MISDLLFLHRLKLIADFLSLKDFSLVFVFKWREHWHFSCPYFVVFHDLSKWEHVQMLNRRQHCMEFLSALTCNYLQTRSNLCLVVSIQISLRARHFSSVSSFSLFLYEMQNWDPVTLRLKFCHSLKLRKTLRKAVTVLCCSWKYELETSKQLFGAETLFH